ncbi:MAG: O-antigen ligase family protein [Gemmatimonadaceae bacterium]
MPPMTLVLILIGALPLALAAVRWERRLVMLMPALVVINGLPLRIGSSQVRIDQVAACLLLVPLLASLLSGKRALRVDATSIWVAALFVVNVIASAVNSPAPGYSLAQCANLASAWVIYAIIQNSLDTRAELDAFLRVFFWSAAAACATGVAAFLLATAGVPVGGAEVSTTAAENLTRAFGAFGTMVEPNILGSFSAAVLVMSIVLLAAGLEYRAANAVALVRATAALSALALVLSFTRSAWLGAVAGTAFVAVAGSRTLGLRKMRIVKPIALLGALAIVVLLIPGSAGDFLSFKLQNLLNFTSRTAAFRLLTYSLALEQTWQHPILGWGTFTFAPLVAQGNDFMQYEGWRNLWIGNYVLLALHDTGIVGLALWVGMLWSVIVRGLRATRTLVDVDPAFAARTLACTAAVVTLLIPFLATTGFSLGYTWLLIGLVGAHARLATQALPAPGPLHSPPPQDLLPADAT